MLAPILDIIRKNAVHASLKAVDASRESPHDTPPSLSHLEASRALLGLAAAARGATRRDESGIQKKAPDLAARRALCGQGMGRSPKTGRNPSQNE
jgi:hypothetical protein